VVWHNHRRKEWQTHRRDLATRYITSSIRTRCRHGFASDFCPYSHDSTRKCAAILMKFSSFDVDKTAKSPAKFHARKPSLTRKNLHGKLDVRCGPIRAKHMLRHMPGITRAMLLCLRKHPFSNTISYFKCFFFFYIKYRTTYLFFLV